MKPSWSKQVILWLAVAAYGLQAVVGGPGVAICLGQANHQPQEVVATESACAHDSECEDAVAVVTEHDSEESCPCIDISIRNEPGRVEKDYTVSFASAAPTALLSPVVAMADCCPPIVQAAPAQPGYGRPPTIVRTIVLLI